MLDLLTVWWDYAFMRYALLGVLLIMPLFSLLGTMVVNNGMSFFSDALGHSALTGIAVGVLLGLADPGVAMIPFAVVFALLMNAIRRARFSSTDTVIGVFSACGIALGLVILSRGGGFGDYQSLLIGDILNITPSQLWWLFGALLAVVILWLLCFNGFHAVSINHTLARSKGLSVALLDNLFVVTVAVISMLSVRWVGLLILNAMLILPAAAARQLARSVRSYHLLSLLFGVVAGVLGLIVSFYYAVATGPLIVLFAATLFFGCYAIGKSEK